MDGTLGVPSAGNAWIILQSQSRPGRIYYFNTSTGESAWNLSEADIEKARRITKNVTTENGHIEPKEPAEPPSTEANMESSRDKHPSNSQARKHSAASTIYNKQIINNQFPKPQVPWPTFLIPPSNQQSAINQLMPLGINSPLNLNAINNGVWAVPPPQPIFLPSVPTLLNHGQTSSVYNREQQFCNQHVVNVQEQFHNNQNHLINVHQTSTSLSGQIKTLRNDEGLNDKNQNHFNLRRNFRRMRDNRNFTQKTNKRQLKKKLSDNDLRSYLTAKKLNNVQSCINCNESEPECNTENENVLKQKNEIEESFNGQEIEDECRGQFNTKQTKNKNDNLDADSDWLEDNILVVDKRLKLDVTKLKELAKPDMLLNMWYIVTDDDVLLNHLNFLNTLCNSDDNCQLMLPLEVMKKLRELAHAKDETRLKKRARRALAFVQQLLEANYLHIGEETRDPEITKSNYLLECSLQIFQHNYLVIILSNDDELSIHKNSTNFPMFTIKEMKQFLANSIPQKDPDKHEAELPVQRPIKITVSNNLDCDKQPNAAAVVIDIETQAGTDKNVEQTNNVLILHNEINKCKVDHKLPVKKTVDISIQTDSHPELQIRKEIMVMPNDPAQPSMEKSSFDQPIAQPSQNLTTPVKKRVIRLNRSISNKTTTSEDSTKEKIQFKWRKRRSRPKPLPPEGIKKAKIDQNRFAEADKEESKAKETAPCKETGMNPCQSESIITHHNVINYDNTSETSSVNLPRNPTNEKIIVDESSTSGIVSNTASNVDSECDRRISDFNHDKDENNRTNFIVLNQSMEDYIRLRCDEWILRLRQIMEDVLRQVLQQDQQFLQNVVFKLYSSGPWSIVESTDCVIRKFNTNHNIVNAASKWKNYYVKISDDTGKINMNLQPSDYMELYSYAVSLVTELKCKLPDCEDLQIAVQSLKELLNDIHNPNMDTSHNDTLDPPQEISSSRNAELESQEKDNIIVKNNENPTETALKPASRTKRLTRKKAHSLSPQKKCKYNLRSKERPLSQDGLLSQYKEALQHDDTKKMFFSNLRLINKTDVVSEVPNTPQKAAKEPSQPSTPTKSVLITDNDEVTNSSTNCIEPKIIRKFTFRPEYESKLAVGERQPLDLDALDYHTEEELDDLDVNQDDDTHYDADNSNLGHEDDEDCDDSSQAEYERDCGQRSLQFDPSSNDINMLAVLINHVGYFLTQVHQFCVDVSEKLNAPTYRSIDQAEVHDKAIKLQVVVNKMRGLLSCIQSREMSDRDNDIPAHLIAEGINELDHSRLRLYRDLINEHLEMARKLENSIDLIISVV